MTATSATLSLRTTLRPCMQRWRATWQVAGDGATKLPLLLAATAHVAGEAGGPTGDAAGSMGDPTGDEGVSTVMHTAERAEAVQGVTAMAKGQVRGGCQGSMIELDQPCLCDGLLAAVLASPKTSRALHCHVGLPIVPSARCLSASTQGSSICLK